MAEPPTLFLIVGLPGAGKTTRARQLEHLHRALRLTPDEWMIPLFGDPEAGDRRDRLEGLLIGLALRTLTIGTDVVLDFGFWGRDERSALRSLGAVVGARVEVIYLPVDVTTQRRRVRARSITGAAQTFSMTDADLERWRATFQEPTEGELAGEPFDEQPPGASTWSEWASRRWSMTA